jgi:putative hydrolase of HD superfamily
MTENCRVESVADHSYRMAMMAMFPPETLSSRLDNNKSIRLALIHDIAESVVGDITPGDGVPKSEKARRELSTVEHIERKLLGNVHRAPDFQGVISLWNEFEEGITLESQFVQDLDKIEMLHQMVEYEKSTQGRADLIEFRYVVTKIRLPEMKEWAEAIVQESREFRRQNGLPEDVKGDQDWKNKQDQYYGAA